MTQVNKLKLIVYVLFIVLLLVIDVIYDTRLTAVFWGIFLILGLFLPPPGGGMVRKWITS